KTYSGTCNLLTDRRLNAIILSGTREDVAARVEEYHQAGKVLPVIQPILQEEDQVGEVVAAAVEYGTFAGGAGRLGATVEEPVPGLTAVGTSTERAPSLGGHLARRAAAWYEIIRPFSLTASTVPVATARA